MERWNINLHCVWISPKNVNFTRIMKKITLYIWIMKNEFALHVDCQTIICYPQTQYTVCEKILFSDSNSAIHAACYRIHLIGRIRLTQFRNQNSNFKHNCERQSFLFQSKSNFVNEWTIATSCVSNKNRKTKV